MLVRPRRSLLVSIVVVGMLACATGQPRFNSQVASGLAQEPMRHLETANVEMYYPASHREAAEHIAARLDQCVVEIRAKAHAPRSPAKLLVYVTLSNFNNAFVQPDYVGAPLQMVLPIHSTWESSNFIDFGTVDEGNVGCHEALHYVQDEQTHGIWAAVNLIFGSVATPSQGLERWFTEGLAVWTEGHIDLHTARPDSPFWKGVFEATVEARGYHIRQGDLSIDTRDIYGSGAYLIGYYFVDYLVRTYGEPRLWELIDREAGSPVGPFALASSFRFDQVYGKSLNAVFDDFVCDVEQTTPRRSRPVSEQVLVPRLGAFARLAVSPVDGAIGVVSDGYDEPSLLTVYDPGGAVRLRRSLTWLMPGRSWIDVGAATISGLRFSPDGSKLYMVASGLSARGDYEEALWELRASDGTPLRHWLVSGFGGDVSPDGKRYLYADVTSDRSNLVEIDLDTGSRHALTDFGALRSLGSPSYSPDGQRVVFPLWTGESFDLALRSGDGQISMLTSDGLANYGPRWIDEHHVVFMRSRDGRWQLHVIDVDSKVITPISDVPHLAIDPMVTNGNRVLFLDRDGVNFSLDAVPLPALDAELYGPPTPSTAPPLIGVPPVTITRDEPYRPLDGLFIPTLRTPFVSFASDSVHKVIATIGASIQGSDRLGYSNYGLNLWTDTASKQPSFIFEYGLNRFSPVFALLHLERSVSLTNDFEQDFREATLDVGRTFWDWPAAIIMTALQQSNNVMGKSRLVGPGATFSYAADETTPYAGVRRAFRFGASANAFPAALGSTVTVGDLRGTMGFTLPLPFSPRHTFSLDVVGRVLPGAPPGLLTVGGVTGSQWLLGACQSNCVVGAGEPLPGGVYLSEPLRGYEDVVFNTTSTVIGTAQYLYPLIIDRGLASVLYVLPSVWVAQINLNLFATDAYISPGRQARAAGGTITLATLWGSAVPINLAYSFELRFDDRLGPLQLISLVY